MVSDTRAHVKPHGRKARPRPACTAKPCLCRVRRTISESHLSRMLHDSWRSFAPRTGGKRAHVPRAQPSLIAPQGGLCTSGMQRRGMQRRGEPTFLPLSSVSLRSLTDFLAIMVIAGVALPLRRVGMVAARAVEAVRREGVTEEARATWVFCGEQARTSEHERQLCAAQRHASAQKSRRARGTGDSRHGGARRARRRRRRPRRRGRGQRCACLEWVTQP